MPMNRRLYPKNWEEISMRIRRRSWGRCECRGECNGYTGPKHEADRCKEINGLPAILFKGRVILTVAHLNHDPADCRDDNLLALCQKCHNRYDAKHRADNRKRSALGRLEKESEG